MKRSFSEVDEVPLPIIIKLVCPQDRIGSVIGKGGEIIKSIRSETGARVKIEDTIPGLHERAVTISSPDKPSAPNCAAQDALERLIARVVEVEVEGAAAEVPETTEVRLIIDRSFMSHFDDPAGANLAALRSSTNTNVRVLPHAQSRLVSGEERVVVVSGPYTGVKRAAHGLLERIRTAARAGVQPAAMRPRGPPGPGAPPVPGRPGMPPPMPPPLGGPGGPPIMIETVYKILMPDVKVGALIGKGGDHLRRIRAATGAEVHVDPKSALEGAEFRVVTCTSRESVDSAHCGAAEALMKAASMVVEEDRRGRGPGPAAGEVPAAEPRPCVRLIAQARHMGAVLGIKGQTIKQLTADTGAKLSVSRTTVAGGPAGGLSSADASVLSPHDELLTIDGTAAAVVAATRIVTMLLRGIMVRQQVEAQGGMPPPAPPATVPPPAMGHHPMPSHGGPAPPRPPPQAYGGVPGYGPPPSGPPPPGGPRPSYPGPPTPYGAPPPAQYSVPPAPGGQYGAPPPAPPVAQPQAAYNQPSQPQAYPHAQPSAAASATAYYQQAQAQVQQAGGYAGYQQSGAAAATTTAAPGAYAYNYGQAAASTAQPVAAAYGTTPAQGVVSGAAQAQPSQPQYYGYSPAQGQQAGGAATGTAHYSAMPGAAAVPGGQSLYSATGAAPAAAPAVTTPAVSQLQATQYYAQQQQAQPQQAAAAGQQQPYGYASTAAPAAAAQQYAYPGTTAPATVTYGAAAGQQQQYAQQYGTAAGQQQQQQAYGQQAAQATTQAAGEARYTIHFPPHQASLLLGPGGTHINRIRTASGARVTLNDTPLSTGDREVEMVGADPAATSAYRMVQALLSTGALPAGV